MSAEAPRQSGEQAAGATAHRWPWPRLVVGALALAYAATGVYFVRPNEQAVVRRFGKVIAESVPPGMHYRLPYPFERVDRVTVRARRVAVGFSIADSVTGRQPSAAEAQFLTGDRTVVDIQLMVQYAVREPARYLFRTPRAERLIEAAAASCLSEAVADIAVDSILTTGKIEAQQHVRGALQDTLDTHGVGVAIWSVSIQRAAPPAEVRDAFADVTSARVDRERIKDEADAYREEIVPLAQGEAEKVKSEALGYRQRRINEATGDTQRFARRLEEYQRAKRVTRDRLYIESMERVLPKMRKVIVDAQGGADAADVTILRAEP
ncbi:MAG: FtsH protease activity modulator HflK [Armatimonadota bacterium]